MFKGWTHLKTGHAGQNHSPHLQFCPVSKEARTHGARAATVTTKRAERKKTKKEKRGKKKREGKRGGGVGGRGGNNVASSLFY